MVRSGQLEDRSRLGACTALASINADMRYVHPKTGDPTGSLEVLTIQKGMRCHR
jgi:hypothetical protein